MKKELLVISAFVLIILFFSISFASAFSFSDIFKNFRARLTGGTIADLNDSLTNSGNNSSTEFGTPVTYVMNHSDSQDNSSSAFEGNNAYIIMFGAILLFIIILTSVALILKKNRTKKMMTEDLRKDIPSMTNALSPPVKKQVVLSRSDKIKGLLKYGMSAVALNEKEKARKIYANLKKIYEASEKDLEIERQILEFYDEVVNMK